MTAVNKAELRRLAEAATPGKWVTEDEDISIGGNVIGVYVAHEDGGRIGQAFANCLVPTDEKCRANAAFIAAANPAAVLSLLDELEAFRKDAGRYRLLRQAHWWESPLCVVRDPKRQVKPGTDCPSGERLDEAVDTLKSQEARNG